MEVAAPGCSRSQRGRQPLQHPRRAVRRVEAPGVLQRLADRRVQPLREMAEHVPALVHLAALHHAAGTEDLRDGPAQARSAVDDEQQRPVRRQPARHEVAQQAAGDGRGLGGALAQAEHVFPALGVDPQRDHHAVVPKDLAVDADHSQVEIPQGVSPK